jgi:hypothetical protein
MTHYDLLYLPYLIQTNIHRGVTRLSSADEIKQAYRRIALSSHPDKVNLEQRDEATKKFQELQVAYEVLQNPVRRREYDSEVFGISDVVTSPGSFEDDNRPHSWAYSMPPTPESSRRGQRYSSFEPRRDEPRLMTFLEATLLFHPEDRRHLWLCSDEDDPAHQGRRHLIKNLYVSLQEYIPHLVYLTLRVFSREVIEVTLFRFRYLDDGTKLVELVRKKIQLKPFIDTAAATIDLAEMGNELPFSAMSSSNRCKQRLSLVPKDEAELFGDNYDGQFFRREGSFCDVKVQLTVYKDDLRIKKKLCSFEFDIPSLNLMSVSARFRGRLKRGHFTTVLKGQGLWKSQQGGDRGDLFVELLVK